jgi:flagellar motor switch protein FliN/FliY
LATVFSIGDVGVLAVLPESSGLIPPWYAAPDATGISRLATLGQELSMLLVPEDFLADEYHARRVSNLAEAVERGVPSDDAALVRLTIQSGENQAQLDMIWPFSQGQNILEEPETSEHSEPKAEDRDEPSVGPTQTAVTPSASYDAFDRLPPYIRSMLQVEVPVQVTLAAKKETIHSILALTPGSIISFDKPCDQLLDLEVGDRRIAQGEAVKVGDKFGLRISTVVLPEERFTRLHR